MCMGLQPGKYTTEENASVFQVWMHERTNEWMHEWTNKQINEWMNKGGMPSSP